MRRTFKRLAAALGLLTLTMDATTQNIRPLPNMHRLPGPIVRTVLQDEEGYIWYGTTDNGLARDNGYQIDMFVGDEKSHFTRTDNFINKMCTTRHHEIVFGTQTGAWILDKRNYRIERLDTTVTMNRDVTSLVVDGVDDSYWLSAGSTLFHLNRERKLISTYEITENGKPQSKLGLYCDSKGRLWLMLNEGGLKLYDRKKKEFMTCRWETEWSPIAMQEDKRNGCFWIGTSYGGIMRYEIPKNGLATQGTLSMQPATLGERGSHDAGRGCVHGICLVNNKLWVSAIDNLYCYEISENGKKLRRFDTSGFLPNKRVILEPPTKDRKGNVWVPSFTPFPFIIMPKDKMVKRYAIEQMEAMTDYPLIADATVQDGDGFWLMQSRAGLMYYSPQGEVLLSLLNGPAHQWLYSYNMLNRKADGNGVWIAEGKSLWKAWLEGGAIKTEKVKEVESPILCLFETSSGDVLTGTENGIIRIDTKSGLALKLAADAGRVNSVLQTSDWTIHLLGSRCGLARIADDGTVETLVEDKRFDKMATDGNHYIWLSSADGTVACYDLQTHELKKNEVASDKQGCAIKRLQVDSDGHLWVLTSLYVKEYNPRNNAFKMFNISDTNIKADYFQDVKAMGKDICFSGAGGIYTTKTSDALDKDSKEAHTVVTEVDIDSTRVFLNYGQTHIEIPAEAEHLVFYISSLNHLDASKVCFAYRVKRTGREEWTYLPVGINVIHLSNLSKGEYTLEVKTTNEHGKWNEGEVVLSIEKLPVWWETWWAWMLYLLLAAGMLTLGIHYNLKQKEKKHLEEMEQRLTDMKFKFFTNISHELRTPLTLIITPLDSIVNAMVECDTKRKLEAILGHAKELLEMINNLLSFRKLEMGMMKLNLRYGELNEFVTQACESFRPIYEKKGLTLHYTPNPTPLNFYFDKNIVHHILFNLLSNAHKFTPTGGNVAVSVTKLASGMVNIEVADTGVGISKEQQKHIFERFYQSDSGSAYSNNGSGIGLNMVSEMVNIHGGTVSVESDIGEGAVFTVKLPWRIKKEEPQKISKENTNAKKEQEKVATEKVGNMPQTDGRFCVLVVEDNDEFRQFIVDELKSEFHVIQAANGKEGIEIAEAEQVDMVVSDVMMPVMDGFEMCKKLKGNDKTSHLNVILLTARSGQESELEGYHCGADYYITKPFSMDILKSKIRQVETQQKERRQELLKHLENPDVDTLFTSDIENQFVKKILDLLDQNIDDCDYGLDELSSDLCMSYITAYRKIKSLTGQAPGEFIRNFRLKRAAQLLRSTSTPVTEVAIAVGFSSASYFTRSFLKEYGMPPSDYRKKIQKGEKEDDNEKATGE